MVVNDKYHGKFVEWRNGLGGEAVKDKVVIYNDFSTSNDTRRGAVADIHLAVESFAEKKDVLVIAGRDMTLADHKIFQKIH